MMRNRQRLPMVFSLSMIDMLCCGLGAVIFLMLLYSWDARRQSQALAATRQRLEQTSRTLGETEQRLHHVTADLQSTQTALRQSQTTLRRQQEELLAMQSQLDHLRVALLRKQEELSAWQSELGFLVLALEEQKRQTEAALEQLSKATEAYHREEQRRAAVERRLTEMTQVAEQVPQLRQQMMALTERIKELEAQVADGRRQLRDLEQRLATETKRRAAAEEQAALLPRFRDDLASALRKANDLESARQQLMREKDQLSARLGDAQRLLETTRQENAVLHRRVREEESAIGILKKQLTDAEGRFAGIDLSGRQVVLLVDQSGSMDYSEGSKPDPNKWPTVCRTVGQVLGSLRQVEKFQVILFSDKVSYPLGLPEDWHSFDPERSPQQVQEALLKVRPGGDTNLFMGFEAAFRFKALGMDAIYLFSDGLPNVGPGLPNPPPKDEAAIAAALGRHVRDVIRRGWNSKSPHVRIHAIGFYYDSPALGAFLWALSRENGGSFVGLY